QAALDFSAQPPFSQITATDSIRGLLEVGVDLFRAPATTTVVPDHDVKNFTANRLSGGRSRALPHELPDLLVAQPAFQAGYAAGARARCGSSFATFGPQQTPVKQPIDVAELSAAA